MSASLGKLKLTLMRSTIGRKEKHIATVHALGLRKIRSQRMIAATPQVIGMVKKVAYMLKVEEVVDGTQ